MLCALVPTPRSADSLENEKLVTKSLGVVSGVRALVGEKKSVKKQNKKKQSGQVVSCCCFSALSLLFVRFPFFVLSSSFVFFFVFGGLWKLAWLFCAESAVDT